jgi:hypothetical protein
MVFASDTQTFDLYFPLALPMSETMNNLILLFASVFCHTVLLAAWHSPYWFALSCLSLSGMVIAAFWPRAV